MEANQTNPPAAAKHEEAKPLEEEEDDGTIVVEKELSAQQESDLFAFLQKVQKACKNDSSVPDFVGSQVHDWLTELQEKGQVETAQEK